MLVSVRHKHCVFAEPVDDHARERVLEAELYLLRLPGEHAEDGLSVAREIERFGLLGHEAGLVADGELCHLVHAVVRQTVALGVGDEVVVFVVPDEGVGAGKIVARALVLAAVHAPVKVAEADLKVPGDGLVDAVDGIVDAFVHRLDAVADGQLPLELRGLILAAKRRKLFNERHRLALGQELARLHCAGEQLQLGQLKRARSQKIPAAGALLQHDIHPERLQARNVRVDTLSLGADAARGQIRHNVLHGQNMILIRLRFKQLLEIQELELLVFRPRHTIASLYPDFT